VSAATVRVRFGLRLDLPFGIGKNAGIMVFKTTETNFKALTEAVALIQNILGASGQGQYKDKIICERS
jgi:hypothetical protein